MEFWEIFPEDYRLILSPDPAERVRGIEKIANIYSFWKYLFYFIAATDQNCTVREKASSFFNTPIPQVSPISPPPPLPQLERLLLSPHKHLQLQAALTLGNCDWKMIQKVFRKVSESPLATYAVLRRIRERNISVPPRFFPHLQRAVLSPYLFLCFEAAFLISKNFPERIFTHIAPAIDNNSFFPFLCQWIAFELKKTPEKIPLLLSLAPPRPAVNILSHLLPHSLPYLKFFLNDPSPEVRGEAIEALAPFFTPNSIPELFELLTDKLDYSDMAIRIVLRHFPPELVFPYCRKFFVRRPRIVSLILHDLTPPKEEIEWYLQFLKSPFPILREEAFNIISRADFPEFIPHILPLFSDPNPQIRFMVARYFLKKSGEYISQILSGNFTPQNIIELFEDFPHRIPEIPADYILKRKKLGKKLLEIALQKGVVPPWTILL